MKDEVDHLLSTLHFVGDDQFLFAVPQDSPPSLLERMFAASKSYYADEPSVDQILEKHCEAWAFDKEDRSPLQQRIDSLVFPARVEIDAIIDAWTSGPRRQVPLGLFVAVAALRRLVSSFTTASLLIRYGYGYEGASLLRLILEQLGWIRSVRYVNDGKIFELSPTGSISGLKGVLPWAGRAYGLLILQRTL